MDLLVESGQVNVRMLRKQLDRKFDVHLADAKLLSGIFRDEISSRKLTNSIRKWMVGRIVSFLDGFLAGCELLVSGIVFK